MLKYYSSQSIERISRLHRLIQEEITGTPRELAFKFNVSERTIYLMIGWLKDFGAMKLSYTYYIGYRRGKASCEN